MKMIVALLPLPSREREEREARRVRVVADKGYLLCTREPPPHPPCRAPSVG
jgi:hypothetical protein